MQHNIIMNCSFSYHNFFIIILLRIRRKQMCFFASIFRNIVFLIVTVIIERFNIHFSRNTWLVATWSFLLGCEPNFINTQLLYCWQLLPASIIPKIFSKCLTTREQRKLILTCFNLENILFSLALETGTINNYFTNTKKNMKSKLLNWKTFPNSIIAILLDGHHYHVMYPPNKVKSRIILNKLIFSLLVLNINFLIYR